MNTQAPPPDAIAAATHPDPYAYYAALRSGAPLVFDEPLRLWVASRADVVSQVLANPACRVRPAAQPVPPAMAGSPAGEVFGLLVRMNDGADHAARKPVLQQALAGIALPAAQARAARLAAGLAVHTLADRTFRLPVYAVASLLGFADDELGDVTDWMGDFVACLSPLASAAQLDAASQAAQALMERFATLVAAQPRASGTLLAAVLQHAQQADWPAGRSLLANLLGLLSQTYEAMAGLLGNSIVALAREPELLARMRAQPDQLDDLVQEVGRHDAPIQNTRRFVADATTVAGQPLAAGEAVLLVLAAANRDAALNPEPEAFMLQRADRQTLGFGFGAHRCPGQALACTIAAAGLRAWLHTDAIAAARAGGWRYRASVNARIPVFSN